MRRMNEELDLQFLSGPPPNELQVKIRTVSFNEFIIPLDEGITDAAYYRGVFQVLEDAGEGDLVRIKINNGGGSLTTALHFATLIRECAATVVAEILCECHSAASVIALACDEWEVGPWAHMLVHTAEYGTGIAKAPDIEQHVAFSKKQLTRVLKEVYDGFLTASEINKVIKGDQLYFDNFEIAKKLEKLKELRTARLEEEMKNVNAKGSA